jgi:hypothetical protein
MRQHLHPNGIASWVVKGQPTKLPIKTADDVREMLAAKLSSQQYAIRASSTPTNSSTLSAAQSASKPDNTKYLSFLNLPKVQKVGGDRPNLSPTTSALKLVEALETLPETSSITAGSAAEDGTLKAAYGRDKLSAHVTRLTGVAIPSHIINFVIEGARRSQDTSKVLDHTGRYKVIFQVDSSTQITKYIKLSSNEGIETARPHSMPMPAQSSDSTPVDSTKKEQPSQEANQTENSSFTWQNQFVSKL